MIAMSCRLAATASTTGTVPISSMSALGTATGAASMERPNAKGRRPTALAPMYSSQTGRISSAMA